MNTIIKSLGENYWIYQGETVNNLPEGYGKLYTNEYKYYGHFINGLFDGEGIIEYIYINTKTNNIELDKKEESKLDVNDSKEDNIEFEEKKSNKKFIKYKSKDKNGKIQNSKFQKASDLFNITDNKIENNKIEDNKKILSYIGTFKDGKKEGNGKIVYDNDNIFIGIFSNDKKNCLGKEFNKFGKELYSCIWKNDRINEKKLHIEYDEITNKKKLEGYIDNEEKIGLWKYYDKDEKLIKLSWYDVDEIKTVFIYKNGFDNLDFNKKYTVDASGEYITIELFKNFRNDIYTELSPLYNKELDENDINILKKYAGSNKSLYLYNTHDTNNLIIRKKDNQPIIKKMNNNYLIINQETLKIIVDNNKLETYEEKLYSKLYNNDYQLIEMGLYINDKLSYGKKINSETNLLLSEGYYTNNMLSNGTLYDNGVIIYKGKLINSMYDDDNGMIYKNGSIHYQGQLKNGQKHGNGIEYNDIIETIAYIGSYQYDMRNGEGELFDECGELIIRGTFENNNLI